MKNLPEPWEKSLAHPAHPTHPPSNNCTLIQTVQSVDGLHSNRRLKTPSTIPQWVHNVYRTAEKVSQTTHSKRMPDRGPGLSETSSNLLKAYYKAYQEDPFPPTIMELWVILLNKVGEDQGQVFWKELVENPNRTNDTCQIITGCIRTMPVPCLYAIAGIEPLTSDFPSSPKMSREHMGST